MSLVRGSWIAGLLAIVGACNETSALSVREDAQPESSTTDDGGMADAFVGMRTDGAVPEGGAIPQDGAAADEGAAADATSNVIPTGLERSDPYPAVLYPIENPFSSEKAMLGKILFWEEQLSSNDTVACGTCHRPEAGGSDPRASEPSSLGAGPNGISGDADDVHGARGVPRCDAKGAPKVDAVYGLGVQVTTRKPPSYLDAMFFDNLFWDGRAVGEFLDPVTSAPVIAKGAALESQAVAPLMNPVEMSCEGYAWSDLESKLARVKPLALANRLPSAMSEAIALHPSYPDLFEWAYGTREITARKVAFAIATHERQLTSSETPWDHFNAGDTTALTEDQRAGLVIFNLKGNCNKCHVPPLFSDGKFHNIGFVDPTLDPGRSAVTQVTTDLGRMKTPSLRNVGLRAGGGLMHNGTFNGATLESVLIIYNQGGGNDRNNIDPLMDRLNLTENESNSLRDFLENALTDSRVRNATAPFDRPKLSTEP